jgi:hypothetical protein
VDVVAVEVAEAVDVVVGVSERGGGEDAGVRVDSAEDEPHEASISARIRTVQRNRTTRG